MQEKLFVYGTLCPGRPNAHELEVIGGEFAAGSVTGFLHDEGWGATMGYPALKLDDSGEPIAGFVFSSTNLHEHWPRLDEFEGEAYERVLAQVSLDDGSKVEAWVYGLRMAQG